VAARLRLTAGPGGAAFSPAPVPPSGLAASVRGVSRSFGQRPVLAGADLDIAEGEFVAMIGRSGSGKSTLLRVLAGLDREAAGSVAVRGPVAVAFQEPRLVPWKRVLANVSLGLRAPSPAAEALALADRVLVLGDGRITQSVPVTLSRPRDRDHSQLTALRLRLLTALGVPAEEAV